MTLFLRYIDLEIKLLAPKVKDHHLYLTALTDALKSRLAEPEIKIFVESRKKISNNTRKSLVLLINSKLTKETNMQQLKNYLSRYHSEIKKILSR